MTVASENRKVFFSYLLIVSIIAAMMIMLLS
jgi:hypothetical protein